jgi:signal peptidase
LSKAIKFVKKHEYARLLIIAIILISTSLATWNGLKIALNTENPILVVVSGSMVPTLNVGDLIIIKGEPSEVLSVGTIIVFHSPADYDTLIVHRIVDKMKHDDDYAFKTKGDFNYYEDNWIVPSKYIVGAYIGKIPYIGIAIMKLKEPAGMGFIMFLIFVMIVLELFEDRKKKTATSKSE